MRVRRALRLTAVLIGVGFFLWVGGVVMSDLRGHVTWMRAHRLILDLNEPDGEDRETRLHRTEGLLNEALRSAPHRPEIRFDMGLVAENLVCLYRGRDDEKSRRRMHRYAELAENSYARATALSRGNGRYRLAHAWSAAEHQLFVKRTLDETAFNRLDTLFRAAADLAPHDPAVQFSCGCFWLMADRMFDRHTRPRAITAFARSIRANPDRWLPMVRERFASETPTIEELHLLIGPRRHLMDRLRPQSRPVVMRLPRQAVGSPSAQ